MALSRRAVPLPAFINGSNPFTRVLPRSRRVRALVLGGFGRMRELHTLWVPVSLVLAQRHELGTRLAR
jgi:hypothetical protein